MTKSIYILKLPLDGQVDIRIQSQLSISTRSERERCENNLTLGVNDQERKPGPMKHRPDLSQAVRQLVVLKQQEGKTNPYIPKHLRIRQRTIEEKARLEFQCKSSSSSFSTWWRPQE